MKVVYNWLKDFVDVKATPDELASHLALSGTNIGGIENGADGAVIDAEASSGAFAVNEVARDLGVLCIHTNSETSSPTRHSKGTRQLSKASSQVFQPK